LRHARSTEVDDGGVSELVVVTGPPGAGKSTAAREVSARFERSAVVTGDSFFAFVDQGFLAPWRAEAHEQNEVVITAAAAAAGTLATGGYTVVYDGVVDPRFLPTFAVATGLPHLHYVVLLPPEETCVERVRSRVGHGFTDLEATRHMFAQFGGADLEERHVIRSTEAAEVIASDVVARLENRSAQVSVPQLPNSPRRRPP
jgi:adenylate kinase family enzyme